MSMHNIADVLLVQRKQALTSSITCQCRAETVARMPRGFRSFRFLHEKRKYVLRRIFHSKLGRARYLLYPLSVLVIPFPYLHLFSNTSLSQRTTQVIAHLYCLHWYNRIRTLYSSQPSCSGHCYFHYVFYAHAVYNFGTKFRASKALLYRPATLLIYIHDAVKSTQIGTRMISVFLYV